MTVALPDDLLADGDHSRSWRRFLDDHVEVVYRSARRVVNDPDEARTVAAEVLRRLAEKWPEILERFQPRGEDDLGEAFGVWLGVVARNLAIDVARPGYSHSNAVSLESVEVLAPLACVPVEAAQNRGAREALSRILAELSGDERELLRLYFLDEVTTADLVDRFGGRTRSQIYNRVHTLMQKLRTRASEEALSAADIAALGEIDWREELNA